MGIFDLFKRRPKDSAVVPAVEKQPETPVAPVAPVAPAKRDYRSKPGHYKPHGDFVRVDNVAMAAGTTVIDVCKTANYMGRRILRRNGRLYLSADDAVYVHREIWAGGE